MITCGNCKGKHATADDVRACYRGKRTVVKDHKQQTLPGVDAYSMEPATDAQVAFIHQLLDQKDTSRVAEMFDRFILDTLSRITAKKPKPISKREASDLLSALNQCPLKPPVDLYPNVPEGKYAIQHDSGEVEFWEVNRPQEGKWKGYTFPSHIVGGVGDWQRMRSPRATIDHAMEIIASDPIKAASLFGYKTRSCGRCASPLSTVRSRAAGYGESCAAKVGWPYPTKQEAQKMLREMGETDVA